MNTTDGDASTWTETPAGESDQADLVSLGAFIRIRRQSLGLTQRQVADRLGWSQERISMLENTRYGLPSLPALARLARALEVPLSALIDAVGFTGALETIESQIATPQAAEVLLYTLERLLAIEHTGLRAVLTEASDFLARAMNSEKIDVFLYDAATNELVAAGTSDTLMGRLQYELGLERLPVADGGRTVEVYQKGHAIVTGHADEGMREPPGITEGLGIRSMVLVPLRTGGQMRGVLSAVSAEEDRFSEDEARFFATVGRWISLIVEREELLSSRSSR